MIATGTAPRLRAVLVAFLALGSIWLAQLAAPQVVRACSCMPWPESLAAYRTDENVVVLAGTVVAANGQRGMFGIERVFKGPVPGAQMPIEGGDPAMCGIGLKLGAKLVMAAFVDQGVLHPSSCTLHAFLPSPEGDVMLADAEESYGGGAGPPPAPADPTAAPAPPSSPTPAGGLALPIALGGVLLLALALFGGIALVARKRR
jgi:hypothetical protein